MKKTMLILAIAAALLIMLTVGLLTGLFSALGGVQDVRQEQTLEDYLAEAWPLFRLRAWDAETGELELEYPLRFSYEQMEKYGAAVEELRDLPAGNLSTVAVLKAAALESAGVTVGAVTVYGLTNDGQTAYTVYPDGSVAACWDTGAAE